MEFDVQKFTNQAFESRTADVPVPDLAAFFKGLPEGETPVWKVRGLDGPELARCNEAQARNRNRNALVEGMLSGQDGKVAEAVKELLGTAQEKVPDDLARRIEMLVIGSVEPECSNQLAVKLSTAFPIIFFELTNKITGLTGLGAEPGKPKRSSGKATSKSPSNSAT